MLERQPFAAGIGVSVPTSELRRRCAAEQSRHSFNHLTRSAIVLFLYISKSTPEHALTHDVARRRGGGEAAPATARVEKARKRGHHVSWVKRSSPSYHARGEEQCRVVRTVDGGDPSSAGGVAPATNLQRSNQGRRVGQDGEESEAELSVQGIGQWLTE